LDKIWHQLPQENLVHELLPSCLNLLLLHIGVSGMHSGQVLCPHICVCLEPAALVVLFTPRTAPVSCFLECVWAPVTAAACVSTQFTRPLVHRAFSRVSSPSWTHPIRCGAPALLPVSGQHSHVMPSCICPFLFCVSCSFSGKHSFGRKGFWHWCEFFLEENGMRRLKIIFLFKNKTKKIKPK